MIKILPKIFVLLAAFALVACEEKPTEPYQTPSSIVPTDGDEVDMESEGETPTGEVVAYIPIETNVQWEATVIYNEDDDPGWISIDPESGKGNATITVTAQKNQLGVGRWATVKITAAKDPSCEKEVIVNQDPAPPFISSQVAVIDAGKIWIDTAVYVDSNLPYNVVIESEDSWIEQNGAITDENLVTKRVPIKINTQADAVSRTGYVKFIAISDASIRDSVEIAQLGTIVDPVLAIANTDSLYASWTGDLSFIKYDVIITDGSGGPITTVTNVTNKYYDLLSNAAVSSRNGVIAVQIKGYSSDPGTTGESLEEQAHTKFANGTGDGAAATPIKIGCMRHISNIGTTLYDKDFLQVSDIDAAWWMDNATFSPLGQRNGTSVAGTPFTGVYDGGNYTISNLKFANNNVASGSTGLFGYIKSASAADTAVVKNLTVANSSMAITNVSDAANKYYDMWIGHSLVVGVSEGGLIENVHVTNPDITVTGGGNLNLGGVVGVNLYLGTFAQAQAGTAAVYGVVRRCSTTGGSIVQEGSYSYISNTGLTALGGVVGVNWNILCLVSYCKNVGTSISMAQAGSGVCMTSAGGIVGCSDGIVEYCKNSGSISGSSTNTYVAGIQGSCIAISSTNNPAFTVNPDADHKFTTGNLQTKSPASQVRYSYNTGNISTSANAYGCAGIAGNAVGLTGTSGYGIYECYNAGTIMGTGAAGSINGIGGRTSASAPYNDCYNEGAIVSAGTAASVWLTGISGHVVSIVRLNRCYNVGQLTFTGTGGGTVKILAAIAEDANNATYGANLQRCLALAGSSGPVVQGTATTVNGFNYKGPDVSGLMFGGNAITSNLTINNIQAFVVSAGGMLTEAQLKTAATWTGEGYTDTAVWTVEDGSYPKLTKIVAAGI